MSPSQLVPVIVKLFWFLWDILCFIRKFKVKKKNVNCIKGICREQLKKILCSSWLCFLSWLVLVSVTLHFKGLLGIAPWTYFRVNILPRNFRFIDLCQSILKYNNQYWHRTKRKKTHETLTRIVIRFGRPASISLLRTVQLRVWHRLESSFFKNTENYHIWQTWPNLKACFSCRI